MNNQGITGNEKPKDLELAEQLIHECKFAEASQILAKLERNKRIPLYYRISCYSLQIQILMWQGKYADCYKKAELAYKESLGLEEDLRTVEALCLMSLSSIILRKFKKGIEIVQEAENLLKTFPNKSSPRIYLIEALIAQNKGYYYIWSNENIDLGLKYLEENLTLRKKFGGKLEIAMGFYGVGGVLTRYKGELERGIEYLKQGLTFANESRNKWPIVMILNDLGNSYFYKGEFDHALEYYKNGLEVAKNINNKHLIINSLSTIGDIYCEKGEFDQALDYLEQAMVMGEEYDYKIMIPYLFMSIIELYLAKGDLDQGQNYYQLLEHSSKQFNDRSINILCLYYNALLLKASPRFRNKIRAEEKFRQILEKKNLSNVLEVIALIHLSDLLFTELRVTNEREILQEIRPLITRLIEVTEKSQSYIILCESYILQAKLALLELDIKTAKRLLIQAAQIAKRYDLRQLIKKIYHENEELIENLDLLDKLKDTQAPLTERLNIINLDQQIERMIQKRTVLTAQIKEEIVTIRKEKIICLVCRGEVLKFSYICECGAIYCDNCAQALTNLENVCWACDVPIDYSKPFEPYKKDEIVKINKGTKTK